MADKRAPRHVRNPLTLIGIFAGLAEVAAMAVLPALEGFVQKVFVWYVMFFPILLVGAFYYILYRRPQVFYAPRDWREERHYMESLESFREAARAMQGRYRHLPQFRGTTQARRLPARSDEASVSAYLAVES